MFWFIYTIHDFITLPRPDGDKAWSQIFHPFTLSLCPFLITCTRSERGVSDRWICGRPLTAIANESAFLAQSTSTISRQFDICLSRVLFSKAKPGIYIPRILYSIVNKSLYFLHRVVTAKGRLPVRLPRIRDGNIWTIIWPRHK